ncbi:MAG: nucleotidyltransferase domain-containing protein [Candidatus Flexifilum sp.]
MTYHERITADPSVYPDKPTVKGTRVLVADVLRTLAEAGSFDAVLAAYPEISADDIRAALEYAAREIERHPPAPEIRRPYTLDDLRRHRDAILRIAAEHNASNVRVFGSVARGDARPGSDVDLLVQFDQGATLWERLGLPDQISHLLGCKVDVSDEQALRPEVRPEVLKDATPL